MSDNTPSIYETVTQKILADLEKGIKPWQASWKTWRDKNTLSLPLRHNGEHYRGINILLLWIAAGEQGYAHPVWMTFKQAQALGGQVMKGEKGTRIGYYATYERQEETAEGEIEKKKLAFLKSYTVFNGDQIAHLPTDYLVTTPNSVASLPEFFQSLAADIRHGGDRAFYSLTSDYIRMPHAEDFSSREAYGATLAHEAIHWTAHPSRLNREVGAWGTEAYAFEELIAELGAAFLCAHLGLTLDIREDHAAYISHWLRLLKQDKRCLFRAASKAQQAVDYLLGLPSKPVME